MSTSTTYIILTESVLQSWARDLGSLAVFVCLIGIGVYVDSSAMQWAGFAIALAFTFGRSSSHIHRMNIKEARAYLDQIEGGSR
ncbi:hypothetical protein V5G24_04300 [Xanthobacter sp. VTT E-85241]|uniref:hypothetical protein n=1 Tax=Roseixanthobacter finlandensis TaxID=3119922 RepID=UPI003727094C